MLETSFRGPVAGFVAGTAYILVLAGLIALAEAFSLRTLQFVSIAMIVGAPIAAGVVTLFFATDEQANTRRSQLLIPWFAVGGWSLISIALAWETVVCVIMLIPVFLPLASLGGFIGGYVRANHCDLTNRSVVSSFSVLPLLLAVAEIPYDTPTVHHTVTSSVMVEAPIDQVWASLPSVANITREELPWTLSHFIGIPRPVSSNTPQLVAGGQRDIQWEQGVRFTETITRIVENELVAYDVTPDQESLKLAALDTHIVIGDQYFDVESGQYALESDGDKTRLSLSTTYRMTTNLNGYGKLWANWVMGDFHYSVLRVLKSRNESTVNISRHSSSSTDLTS